MSATEENTEDGERWEYTGTGTGGLSDGFTTALLEQTEARVQTYGHPTDTVHFGIVVGHDSGDGDHVDANIELDPDDAEAFARDLLEMASVARDNER